MFEFFFEALSPFGASSSSSSSSRVCVALTDILKNNSGTGKSVSMVEMIVPHPPHPPRVHPLLAQSQRKERY